MPIVGVSEKRRQQLIQATISSVDEFGLQHTTIHHICVKAGLFSGLRPATNRARLQYNTSP
uniref:Uncharacterized protein n=1 Tax=Escherichia coli TaxID=562 RepID=A0A3L0YGG2_ECOLX